MDPFNARPLLEAGGVGAGVAGACLKDDGSVTLGDGGIRQLLKMLMGSRRVDDKAVTKETPLGDPRPHPAPEDGLRLARQAVRRSTRPAR